MTTMYVNWGETKVKLTWKSDNKYPQHNEKHFTRAIKCLQEKETKRLLHHFNNSGGGCK
ncbi:hypothetical protein [Halobacillus amylolyticus]|uniref:Uncharacterized protein n=1 Tax=Halobacillus amylolyticus TaxID=2932259 RepID=A0ABY4HDN9_9BACI|nr:hypothetical protein [Halobacillus amylolyticus]UOR12839.1 hypothetical protein MUO15_04830 [Halobacillus amylolyticus]